ncbi:MAG: DUF1887 family CARF protein [Acidobacteriota bacterium]
MDLSKYQSEHLLLLVGKNPLPNAVAGSLLVKQGGSITLLYTESTASMIGRFQKFLPKTRFETPISLKEADAHSIYEAVFKALAESKGRSVGLHYTGGTKTMSVHAYAAARRWSQDNQQPPPTFSYLDARTLHLVIDPSDPLSHAPESEPIGDAIKIGLRELITLHGWSFNKKKSVPRPQPLLPKTAAALARLHSDAEAIDVWKKYQNQNLKEWPLPLDDELSDLRTALSEEFICSAERIEVVATLDKHKLEKNWLTGGFWLEHHVLKCLIELNEEIENLRLHDCCQAVKIDVNDDQDFDLDVVALRGYQLFAFSCGVRSKPNDRGELKLKLFEAYVRARQLGGDESRVALVSTSPDPKSLQDELERDINSEGHIKVFGQKHLSNLKPLLGQWIKEQSRIT